MMGPDDLRAWCMKQPRPHVVNVTSTDGSIHEVLCNGPWTAVGETLAALQPELLQAMTAEGKLLRAVRPLDQSEDWSPDGVAPVPLRMSNPENIPLPAGDPETQRFALVAQLIANAYRHANDVAFSRLVQLVDAQNQRSNDVERAREQLYKNHVKQLEDQIRAAGQEPPAEGELLGTMLAQFMGGLTARQPDPPPAPKTTNGKGH